MPRLLVIDFSNIVHRSYHGYPPMTGPSGEPVHAAYGAGASVLRLIETYHPTHLVAAMDAPRQTLRRRELAGDYKEHRSETDPDLAAQYALATEVYAAIGATPVGCDGEEADDVAATLAVRFPGQVVIATGDKDLLGTCSADGRVRVHLLGKDTLIDAAGCERIMGVAPHLVADLKALIGDPSDGYRGVNGIGVKGALSLLGTHGDLDRALAASDQIPGALGTRLRAGLDEARRCQQLARLNTEAPLPPVRARFHPTPGGVQRLGQLGFPALAARLQQLARTGVNQPTTG